jgi:DNA-directed RNA polymerase subunit RPC12/RpoP
VAVAFPDAKFVISGGPFTALDDLVVHIEQGEKVFVREVEEKPKPKKNARIHSAWQNYREARYRCSDCKKSWLGADLLSDFEGSVLGLRCPDCDRKLRNLSVEATNEQIEEFAAEGSTEAIDYLKMLAARAEEVELEKESE